MSPLRKADLTLSELQALDIELRKKSLSRESMWALWAFLSYFGAHRFYLGDAGLGSAMFLTSFVPLIGVLAMAIGGADFDSSGTWALFLFFCFWLGASVLWSWIDAFFINARLEQRNEDVETEALERIRLSRAPEDR